MYQDDELVFELGSVSELDSVASISGGGPSVSESESDSLAGDDNARVSVFVCVPYSRTVRLAMLG